MAFYSDIDLAVAFFLIITGILTWAILAIVGAWHVITWLEKLCDSALRVRRTIKIYRL
jgi:hypothetical protein